MRGLGVALLFGVVAAPAAAQAPSLRGYVLVVGVGATSGPFTASGIVDLQRARAMLAPTFGLVALDAAYEQQLAYRSAADAAGIAGGLGQAGSATWLPLQGSAELSEHWTWAHRVDRLALTVSAPWAEITVGRQTISWATTLLLTPADPFAPFEPSQPFREYRAGIDAARVQVFPGPFTEVDLVLRPADTPAGRTITALARAASHVGTWELSAWAGVVHDDPAAATAATVTVGGAVVRFEATLRRAAGTWVSRATLGVDRSVTISRRTLYVAVEYQHDGFGAADGDDLARVVASAPARRGELQTFGRDAAAVQARFDLHPLVAAHVLGLWNLGDGSLLVAPAASYGVAASLSLRAGLFLGAGRDRATAGLPGSEYGPVPAVGYLSLSAFF